MALTNCSELSSCDDTCKTYDLCQVTVSGNGNCMPNGENQIVCEGFKFTTKVDSEVKNNSSCYEGYGYQVSNLSYEWEITNPCDRDWFDKRIVAQLCDKYSMQITGYVQEDCGEWTPKETLTACFIDETGRDYGKGVSRSLKGKALHRIVHSTQEDSNGNISNASASYVKTVGEMLYGGTGGTSVTFVNSKQEQDYLKEQLIAGAKGALVGGATGIGNPITMVGGAVGGAVGGITGTVIKQAINRYGNFGGSGGGGGGAF